VVVLSKINEYCFDFKRELCATEFAGAALVKAPLLNVCIAPLF